MLCCSINNLPHLIPVNRMLLKFQMKGPFFFTEGMQVPSGRFSAPWRLESITRILMINSAVSTIFTL